MFDYSIATAHSAGPGYELSVVCCMLYLGDVFGDLLVIWWYSERTWGLLGCIWEPSEAILGNAGAILGLSWEDLGATWAHFGGGSSSMESTYLFESIAGARDCHVCFKNQWNLDGFENAVFSWHQQCIPCRNVKIALALRPCSEIALQCQHQCKKADRCHPEMLIQPV